MDFHVAIRLESHARASRLVQQRFCCSGGVVSDIQYVLQDGVHYHFTSKEDFERGIGEGKFIEYAHVHNNIYGTSFDAVKAVQQSGKCCILDIDVQGARQVRASDLAAIVVFIAPPSLEELEKRLRGRGTESEEQIQVRSAQAKVEMDSLHEKGLYDAVIVNDSVDDCFEKLKDIAQIALNGGHM